MPARSLCQNFLNNILAPLLRIFMKGDHSITSIEIG